MGLELRKFPTTANGAQIGSDYRGPEELPYPLSSQNGDGIIYRKGRRKTVIEKRLNYTPKEITQFERFQSNHSKYVYGIAYRNLGNPHDAQDVTQEVFIRVLKHLREVREGTDPRVWLYRITVNIIKDMGRIKSREGINEGLLRTPSKEGEEMDRAIADTRMESDPEKIFFDNELAREVRRALDILPENLRKTVMLCDMEGYSYKEIGEMTETKIGTVKSRLHRARNMLRESLEPLATEQGYSTELRATA